MDLICTERLAAFSRLNATSTFIAMLPMVSGLSIFWPVKMKTEAFGRFRFC